MQSDGWRVSILSLLCIACSVSLPGVFDTTPRGVLTFQTSLLFARQESTQPVGREAGFQIRPDLIGINKVTNVRVSDGGAGTPCSRVHRLEEKELNGELNRVPLVTLV